MQNPINVNSFTTKENTTKLSFNIQESQNENTFNQSLIELSTKKEKPNICHFCNKQFSTLGNMRNHIMVIHENYRPFKCTYPGCNKKYSIESRYQVHLRTHIGSKPFICQICNKSFNEKGNLKTHLRFHSEIRPFKCPHCNKSYKTNGHLRDHIEILHNKIKKYICKFCKKQFGRISTLKAHNRTHTGEKNYKCKIEGCEKYFAEKGNMEIHYRRHLKKLNKNSEINEKIKKKYGIKDIQLEYENKIKEAIDNLKNKNNNYSIIEKNNKKLISVLNSNKVFINNDNDQHVQKDIIFQVNNDLDKNYLLIQNLHKENNLTQNNDIINNIKSDNIKHFNKNMNPLINYNNCSNKEQNVNIGNENHNIFGSLSIYPLNQELHQPYFFQQNKIDNLFNKESNYIDIDISNNITRPCSNTNLCRNKEPDNIFAKNEDLFSDDEDFSQGYNRKNISDNSYISNNTNLGFNQNYDFLENKQDFKNEERINNYKYNFTEINEAKNTLKYQEHYDFLDKDFII